MIIYEVHEEYYEGNGISSITVGRYLNKELAECRLLDFLNNSNTSSSSWYELYEFNIDEEGL